MKQLDPDELVAAYHRLRKSAPHRHKRGKQYFVGHSGITSSGKYSNRREEHLAVALWNSAQENRSLIMPDGLTLRLLDYQFPLKAQRSDTGVGKVDLFGTINNTKACVVELKIHPLSKGRSDTPLRAFLEALAYCAIVEANAEDIAQEVLDQFGQKLIEHRPVLIVMAPEQYWLGYISHQRAAGWWSVLRHLVDQLAKSLDLECHFIVLRNSDFEMGLDEQKPKLVADYSLCYLSDFVHQQTNERSNMAAKL